MRVRPKSITSSSLSFHMVGLVRCDVEQKTVTDLLRCAAQWMAVVCWQSQEAKPSLASRPPFVQGEACLLLGGGLLEPCRRLLLLEQRSSWFLAVLLLIGMRFDGGMKPSNSLQKRHGPIERQIRICSCTESQTEAGSTGCFFSRFSPRLLPLVCAGRAWPVGSGLHRILGHW
ncbi:uncharacterized protein F5Z01DRAFT_188072 [Emericellopsis atlantica]|uniref:Uncharacterized protein n=1 Tax=Emericellopsis atlantica TaxID=2614577 RepID=A0A9P8CN96_9HYPO|nr:uncharacterized protein F5Z01DRAFT_188072 [Emericellopsis atlantica]KAG9252840.1 hypothetical protein F5Z01DRAFT_188072 [Emericellopsis atlantica]